MPKKPDNLPSNPDAERFLLGSILLNGANFVPVSGLIEPGDLFLEANRRIFSRMKELFDRGEKIDRVTVANELMKLGQLESIGGLSYLVSLDQGLPDIDNFDSYIRIVRDKSALRRVIMASQSLMDQAMNETDVPASIIENGVNSLRKISQDNSIADDALTIGEHFDRIPGGPLAILDPSVSRGTIATGFDKLDEMLGGGFEPGTLVIIGGRPSQGKTSIATNMMDLIAKDGTPVGIFSLEMSARELMDRAVSARARVNLLRFRAGDIDEEERDACRLALESLYGMPIIINDSPTQSLNAVASISEKMVREHGVKVIWLDHLQMMSGNALRNRHNMNVTQILQDICESLKAIAKRLKICFVALSQMSRPSNGDMRPSLMQLRESGGIEQTADVVLLVFREGVYKRERADLRNKAELILAKQRNGPTGSIPMRFQEIYARFEDE